MSRSGFCIVDGLCEGAGVVSASWTSFRSGFCIVDKLRRVVSVLVDGLRSGFCIVDGIQEWFLHRGRASGVVSVSTMGFGVSKSGSASWTGFRMRRSGFCIVDCFRSEQEWFLHRGRASGVISYRGLASGVVLYRGRASGVVSVSWIGFRSEHEWFRVWDGL
ncbi:hypothetical protein Dimus_036088 [Dionaea muscipula]